MCEMAVLMARFHDDLEEVAAEAEEEHAAAEAEAEVDERWEVVKMYSISAIDLESMDA